MYCIQYVHTRCINAPYVSHAQYAKNNFNRQTRTESIPRLNRYCIRVCVCCVSYVSAYTIHNRLQYLNNSVTILWNTHYTPCMNVVFPYIIALNLCRCLTLAKSAFVCMRTKLIYLCTMYLGVWICKYT